MEELFDYLNAIVPMRRLEHEFVTHVEADRNFYTFPIHKDDIPRMPERETIERELAAAQEIHGWTAAKNCEEYWIASVERQRGVTGKSVSVGVNLGGRRNR